MADTWNHRIQQFTSDGNFVAEWGSRGSGNMEFYAPHGIATDAEGNVYVADTGNHRIQKFDPDGPDYTQWGSFCSGAGEFDEPLGIAVGPEGNVYVVDTGNNRIQKFSSDGAFITRWGGWNRFRLPVDVAVDTAGNVYVVDQIETRVLKFTSDGTFITEWGKREIGGSNSVSTKDGVFNYPQGIAVSTAGEVYVADTGNQRIQKFTSDGDFTAKWGSLGKSDGEFFSPGGIAVDTDGNIHVTDSGNTRIQKCTPEGTCTSWGTWGNGDGEFVIPAGIALDEAGNIYVVDSFQERIHRCDSDGNCTSWGRSGSLDGEFWTPKGIAVVPTGEYIYVADTYNDRIQKCDPEGTCALWSDGEFIRPKGIAVDKDGNVYVADTGNSRIQKCDTDGNCIAWGNRGTGDGEFIWPEGITTDSSGFVYVADTGNGRIQKFTSVGDFIAMWGNFGTNPGHLNKPADLAVDNNGRIFVADTENHRIQVFKVYEMQKNPKAIIVAGGGPFQGNSLWDATLVCTNFAYRALNYQGFDDDDIYYLSADTSLNSNEDKVDYTATIDNLKVAIAEAVDTGADSLVLYFADHGGDKRFQINESEILCSSDTGGPGCDGYLAPLLDDLQDQITGRIIVINEACESGSFVDDLQGDNRVIITSTLPGEKAKFLNDGLISFSYFFWNYIFNGMSIEESYSKAGQAINFSFANQNPQLSGQAENLYIGNGIKNMIGEAPEIGDISGPQDINGSSTSAVLYADSVTDPDHDGIARVWAVIWPPNLGCDYNPGSNEDPLLDAPKVDLVDPDGDGRYEGTYSNFNQDGTYYIAIYAIDRSDNTSIPQLTTVSRNYSSIRKAVIVAGGLGQDLDRPMIETNAGLAYAALKAQLYNDDDIEFRSVTTFGGTEVQIDGSPRRDLLGSHITGLGGISGELDLTIYLIGGGDSGTFKITNSEDISAADLKGWLDTLQTSKPDSRVTLIYDGDKAGSFVYDIDASSGNPVPVMAPPGGAERILITSTGREGAAYFRAGGDVSFSSFFWGQVSGGATVYNAYAYAKKSILYLSRKGEVSFSCYNQQDSLLEANGNGVANEGTDYQAVLCNTIGIGMKFADAPPQIGSVSVDESGEWTLIIARDITSTNDIDTVWAEIKPVGYCPEGSGGTTPAMVKEPLEGPDQDGTYWDIIESPDYCYKVNVYAMDVEGNTSLPKESRAYQAAGGDIYEDDSDISRATAIVINHPIPQPHDFHLTGDVDWVKFYGIPGQDYRIKAGNLEETCGPVIELYYENEQNWRHTESTYMPSTNSVSFDYHCPQGGDGIYYLKLFNGASCANTDYELQVDNWDPGDLLVLIGGTIENQVSREGIDGAIITTNGGGSTFSVWGKYDLYQKPGSWTIEASADGYVSYFEGISVESGDQIIPKDIMMYPTNTSTTTTISPTTTIPVVTTMPATTTTPTSVLTTTVSPGPTTTTTTITAGPSTTTTGLSTTTTSVIPLPDCEVTIDPAPAHVLPLGTIQFTAATLCDEQTVAGTYRWSVGSIIGSTIDEESGLYIVGGALDGIDTVKVIDTANGNTEATAVVICSLIWPLAYDKMWGTSKDENLLLLRVFRDEVLLNTEAGRDYVSILYVNSQEIATLLLQEPSLTLKTREVIDDLLMSVESLLYTDEIAISQYTLDNFLSLLDDFESTASPRLKTTIKKVKRDIKGGEVFEQLGITLSE